MTTFKLWISISLLLLLGDEFTNYCWAKKRKTSRVRGRSNYYDSTITTTTTNNAHRRKLFGQKIGGFGDGRGGAGGEAKGYEEFSPMKTPITIPQTPPTGPPDTACDDCVVEMFYYRLSYTFVEADGRDPNANEKRELMEATNNFYRDSLANVFTDAVVESVNFQMVQDRYNATGEQYVMQGTVDISFSPDGVVPTREALFEQMDELPLQPYFVDYLFQTQPDNNVFRRTTRIRTEFREETPFEDMEGGSPNPQIPPTGPTPPSQPTPTRAPTMPPTQPPVPAASLVPTVETTIILATLPVYFRFVHTLPDDISREPNQSDIDGLLGAASDFYYDQISNLYQDAQLHSVTFQVDGSSYDPQADEFVIVGTMLIAFDASAFVPSGGALFTQLTSFNLALYMLNYLPFAEPGDNVFRSTLGLNVEFSVLSPYPIPGPATPTTPAPTPPATTPSQTGGGVPMDFYYRLTYSFSDDGTDPTQAEIDELSRVTNDFYLQSLQNMYSQAAVNSVQLDFDTTSYDGENQEFVVVGVLNVDFADNGNVPARGLVFSQLDDLDQTPYFINYLFQTQPDTNVFRETTMVAVEFNLQFPFLTSFTPPPTPLSAGTRSPQGERDGDTITENYYYRFAYSFAQGAGRQPDLESEFPSLIQGTETFYLQSIQDLYPEADFESVTFQVDETQYNDTTEEFVMQGTMAVTIDSDDEIPDDLTRANLFVQLDDLNLIPYFNNYLFRTQPPTNIFRLTSRIRVGFDIEMPFPALAAGITPPPQFQPTPGPPSPSPTPLPTRPTPSVVPSATPPPVPPERIFEMDYFYRLNYTFQDGSGRAPQSSEIQSLIEETERFYEDSIDDLYDDAEVADVTLTIDEDVYLDDEEQYVMVGNLIVSFDNEDFVPSYDALFNQLDDIDLTPYFMDYLIETEPDTSIFRFTRLFGTRYRTDGPFDLILTAPPSPPTTPAPVAVVPSTPTAAPTPCPSCVQRTLYYRMIYSLQEDRGRAPIDEELPPMITAMNRFFSDSLNAEYNDEVVALSFEIDETDYNEDDEQITVLGSFDAQFLDNGEVPSGGDIINEVLRTLDLLPFILNYMFDILPAGNVFRLLTRISAEFNQSPYEM